MIIRQNWPGLILFFTSKTKRREEPMTQENLRGANAVAWSVAHYVLSRSPLISRNDGEQKRNYSHCVQWNSSGKAQLTHRLQNLCPSEVKHW